MAASLRKLFFFFITILIFSLSNLSAQTPWTRITPSPVETNIRDMVRIPGTDRLIAVTNGSTIMTSDDQGVSWDISLHPANLENDCDLNSLYFIDNLTGFIGCSYNKIIKTTDGGLTWSVKYSETTIYPWMEISDVCFMNDTLGFAIGSEGLFLKSLDRGETWLVMDTVLSYDNKFHKINKDIAYITSGNPNNWFKTYNGGESWVTENLSSSPGAVMSGIYFLDENNAVASFYTGDENSKLYKTTDHGVTWHLVSDPGWGIYSVLFSFIDELHGIAFCASVAYYSTIQVTEDGGETWTLIEEPLTWYNMEDTYHFNANIVFVAGTGGKIYRSIDAGYTWTEISHRELGGEIYEVQFVNEEVGYLTCSSFGGGVISTVFNQTTDGGNSWHYIDIPEPYPSTFHFLSESSGFIAFYNDLLRYNQGEWDTVNTGFDFEIEEINFYDEMVGVVAGKERVIKTVDGGYSWSDITPIASQYHLFKHVEFGSQQNIFLTSYNRIFRSHDGGVSWQFSELAENYEIGDFFLVNVDTAFVIAWPDILRSVDGLETWNPCQLNSDGEFYAKSVCFPTPATGYVVGSGNYNTIFKTTDGGDTWDSLPPYSSTELTDLYFRDAENGLVFGDKGLVMKTQTGGVVSAGNIAYSEINYIFNANPNPFTSVLNISFNHQPAVPLNISVSDMTGKVISRQTIKSATAASINTALLKPGVYLLTVYYRDGSSEVRKVIK